MSSNATTIHESKNPQPGQSEAIMDRRTNVIGWTGISSFLLFAILAQFGCSLSPSPYDEHAIVALFPADGAASVPRNTPLRIDAGWGTDAGSTIDAVLVREDGWSETLSCERSARDEQWFECDGNDRLESGTTYTLSAGEGEERVASTFTTASPAGRGYEIGASMKIEQFGSNQIAADGISDVMEGAGPMVLVAGEASDGIERWHWGPAKDLPQDAVVDYTPKSDVGYPVALDVTSDGESFHGWAEHAYMPIELEGDWHYVRLDEVSIRGSYLPGTDTIALLELEALVTSTSITRLANLFDDEIANLLISVCRPNVDTDGDGEDDAARFRLTTSGIPADVG